MIRCAVAVALLAAASVATAVTSVRVAAGFALPVDIANAGDGSGRLFVVEQRGTIQILANGQTAPTPFLDIGSLVLSGGEQGLLGLAFHPQYRHNGRFFVDYTRAGDGATVIAEYRVSATNANAADPSSERVLLTIAQPFANHNGGALRFGPDGYLYVGMGDGGSGNDPGGRAQNRSELLGKILRLDVDRGSPYGIPATNPFADGVSGRPEIWAYGLRNPWRFAFDRATGDFYIGDVGQDAYEEIDRVPAGTGAGANFGWRVMEGFHCTSLTGPVGCNSPSLTLPIVEYSHALGCSVTGGAVYRGAAVPALAARYVYADYCSGRLWSAGRTAGGAWGVRDVMTYGGSISTFGEDEQGELYFADLQRGEIRVFVAEATDRVDAVEYYHAGFDHYFVTATPSEIHALDAGTLKGWQRTGEAFAAFGSLQAGVARICRFYIPPAFGDSHFLSASGAECADVRRRFPQFVEEGPLAMFVIAPDAVSGACPAGSQPVYRIWNRRADSNHRYATSTAIRARMVQLGGVAEGYGPDAVAICAAP